MTSRDRTLRAFAASLCIVLLTGSPAAGQEEPAQGASLEGLAWLAGCWRLTAGERVTDEQWMAPRAGLMMGMSRTVREGAVRSFERLLIRWAEEGVEYVADPSGQRETIFTDPSPGDGEWVFANEEHDFPQRIVYRRLGTDSLLAYIEGEVEGQVRRVDFPMARAACESLP